MKYVSDPITVKRTKAHVGGTNLIYHTFFVNIYVKVSEIKFIKFSEISLLEVG
ncbi:hypothetical protein L9F63_004872, partial [Diploptera punctata]